MERGDQAAAAADREKERERETGDDASGSRCRFLDRSTERGGEEGRRDALLIQTHSKLPREEARDAARRQERSSRQTREPKKQRNRAEGANHDHERGDRASGQGRAREREMIIKMGRRGNGRRRSAVSLRRDDRLRREGGRWSERGREREDAGGRKLGTK